MVPYPVDVPFDIPMDAFWEVISSGSFHFWMGVTCGILFVVLFYFLGNLCSFISGLVGHIFVFIKERRQRKQQQQKEAGHDNG